MFCGRSCLDAALDAYHRAECGALGHLVPPRSGASELSPMALLAYRIVVQAAGLSRLVADVAAGTGVVVLPEAFVELHQVDGGKKKRKKKRSMAGFVNKLLAILKCD